MVRTSRRAYLGTLVAGAFAGCTDAVRGGNIPLLRDDSGPEGGPGPPTADHELPIPDPTDELADDIVSGGVSQDGIPSIDDPVFIEADEADGWLEDGEPVFGVDIDGDVRAYPQRVLVWHEIVNDEIAGESLAVTYCPLTGTAQGFERGDTEFGVSGRLLNSNLIMYDRATESYWPQMLATGITGDHEGSVLREFPVTWTTWERWHDRYPETTVLSEETGYARNYGSDPYGSYNPPSGFYESDSLFFAPYTTFEDPPYHIKEVVLGARSSDGAIAVHKDSLLDAGVLEGEVGGVPHVAVAEPELATGYIYRNPDAAAVGYDDGQAEVDGDAYDPGDLPLERVLRFDAFWFAWAGYYPDTEILE